MKKLDELFTKLKTSTTRKTNKPQHKKREKKHKKFNINRYLEKAGYVSTNREILTLIFYVSIFASTFVFIFWSIISKSYNWIFISRIFLLNLVLILPGIFIISSFMFYLITDLLIDKRKDSIEKVFPEYLQIVSANIRAGMPLDQALWKGIRPSFGVLSREIEIVSKQSMIGDDLSKALLEFGGKYDSKVIKRSINLIIEGIEAGGEIGELLEDTSLNLEDIQIRKQSMAANVTSYEIFITFAVIGAAPILYAAVAQILKVIKSIGSGIDFSASSSDFAISATAITNTNFLIFAILSLFLSATGASVITAAIKSGSLKESLKKMPWFWLISISLFLVSNWGLGKVFATFF